MTVVSKSVTQHQHFSDESKRNNEPSKSSGDSNECI
jgi:hypothetical protein